MGKDTVTPAGLRTYGPLIVILAALAATVLYFLQRKLHYLTDYSLASYTEVFWPRRAVLVPHLLGGAVAITAGIVQLWLGLTHRIGTLHRALGKLYVGGVVVGSCAGFYLALHISAGYFAYASGLFMMSAAWVICTGMAYWCIRRRHIEQHREWMIRSYVVTFSFVTFRLATRWLHDYFDQPYVDIADDIDTALAWGSWALPLLVAEPLIQLRRIRQA